MSIEEMKAMAAHSADPKWNFNNCQCKRCGKKVYVPMPGHKLCEEWGVFAWTVLVIAHLTGLGWRVVKTTFANGDYVCPDCLTEKDTDVYTPVPSAVKADEKYTEWVNEMKEKYGLTH